MVQHVTVGPQRTTRIELVAEKRGAGARTPQTPTVTPDHQLTWLRCPVPEAVNTSRTRDRRVSSE